MDALKEHIKSVCPHLNTDHLSTIAELAEMPRGSVNTFVEYCKTLGKSSTGFRGSWGCPSWEVSPVRSRGDYLFARPRCVIAPFSIEH